MSEPRKKISYEQDNALAYGRSVARANQRRRVAANQRLDAENAARAAEDAKRAERELELRNGFSVGDRVAGRDYMWNERRTGTVVDGSLTDGVPVLCDDGVERVLYRRSLEATS